MAESLNKLVGKRAQTLLSDRELEVLKLCFGIKGSRPYKLSEVGEMLGVTRERVRQIESEALAKLQQAGVIKDIPMKPRPVKAQPSKPVGYRLTEEYMVRLDIVTDEDLRQFADEMKLPPTTLARKLIQYGLRRKSRFKAEFDV